MLKKLTTTFAALTVAAAFGGAAMAQTGPVATACSKEITEYCAKAGHGNAQTRNCLQKHRKQLSATCRDTLDTTGGGRGRNRH